MNPILPIMIGAFKPKMLRLAAKYANGWNVSSTGILRYRRLANEFEQACADVGRDSLTVRRACLRANTSGSRTLLDMLVNKVSPASNDL